jgi:cell division septum initiation protein DivIVA
MHDIEKKYREQVTANKKIRYEIKVLKMQVQEAEKELASMKSNSSH